MPCNPFLDTVGPLARTAAECAAGFRVLAGAGGRRAVPVARLRVGWPETYFQLLHPDTSAALEGAARRLEELGATVVVLDARDGPLLDNAWQGFAHTWLELASTFRELVDDPWVHPAVAVLLRIGREMPRTRHEASRARAGEVRRSFQAALEKADVQVGRRGRPSR